MVDRRQFVTAAAASLVAAALPSEGLSLADVSHARRLFAVAWFQRRVNARVELQGELWHLVRLIRVVEHASGPELEQFTLVFGGSRNDPLAEGIYQAKLDRRTFSLFLQPSGGDANTSYYRASFSLIRA
jgi:hypothetical protein